MTFKLMGLGVGLGVGLLVMMASGMVGAADEWDSLNNCVGRLKHQYEMVEKSVWFKMSLSTDRRLYYMLEGVRSTEYNSNRLLELAQLKEAPRDKYAPYLIVNATAACEKYEATLSAYMGGFKQFLMFFILSLLSVSLYASYLTFLLIRRSGA